MGVPQNKPTDLRSLAPQAGAVAVRVHGGMWAWAGRGGHAAKGERTALTKG